MQEKNREFRQAVRLRSCVRPVDAAHMSLAQMGSAIQPKQAGGLEAIDRDGSLDRRFDRLSSHSALNPGIDEQRRHHVAAHPRDPRHASHLVHRPNSRGAWLNHGRSRAVVQSPATRSGRVRRSPATLPRRAVFQVRRQARQPGRISLLRGRERGDPVAPLPAQTAPIGGRCRWMVGLPAARAARYRA